MRLLDGGIIAKALTLLALALMFGFSTAHAESGPFRVDISASPDDPYFRLLGQVATDLKPKRNGSFTGHPRKDENGNPKTIRRVFSTQKEPFYNENIEIGEVKALRFRSDGRAYIALLIEVGEGPIATPGSILAIFSDDGPSPGQLVDILNLAWLHDFGAGARFSQLGSQATIALNKGSDAILLYREDEAPLFETNVMLIFLSQERIKEIDSFGVFRDDACTAPQGMQLSITTEEDHNSPYRAIRATIAWRPSEKGWDCEGFPPPQLKQTFQTEYRFSIATKTYKPTSDGFRKMGDIIRSIQWY